MFYPWESRRDLGLNTELLKALIIITTVITSTAVAFVALSDGWAR